MPRTSNVTVLGALLEYLISCLEQIDCINAISDLAHIEYNKCRACGANLESLVSYDIHNITKGNKYLGGDFGSRNATGAKGLFDAG
jgi:hypothetical protein